ncbi:hemolysin family protein [Changpingibacter yushuensis]|uniref:hemolysin family protein n=1 Tax=Changpingibacter yushuensis TaxID=2758440 RepID=UPI00165E8C20|nr:hemolysin family protein [Changpingibacter yushuensis]
MDPLLRNFLFVLIFISVGGIFSASEMALVSLRQTQINEMAKESARGVAVKRLTADSNRFLSAVQVGVTVAGFFSASFGASEIAPMVAPVLVSWGLSSSAASTLAFILVTCFIAYLSIVLGELIPKRIAMQSARSIALAVVRPLAVITALLRPVIWFLGASTNVVLRLIGRNPKEQRAAMGAAELRAFVASQETIRDDEREMVVDMLSVGDRTVQEIMTPRTEVEFFSSDMPIHQAQTEVSTLDHSRYPVRQGDSDDDVLGFIHIRDLINPVPEVRVVGDLVREVMYFPTGKLVLEALTEMRAKHEHLAVVVDEYGGTDGIITLEDVVEEFIGEIRDEYDHERPVVMHRGEAEVVDGLANRAEVLKALGRELPDGPYDTLAGFVVAELGRMPEVGDQIEWAEYTLSVTSLDGRRIDRVTARRRPDATVAGLEDIMGGD